MDTRFNFNKTEKFDFDKVGKRMPYSTPEGFFKEMEANILEAVKNDTPKPDKIERKKRPLMRVMWTAVLAVAASVAVLLVLHIDFSAPMLLCHLRQIGNSRRWIRLLPSCQLPIRHIF